MALVGAVLAAYLVGAVLYASARIDRQPVAGLAGGGVRHVLVTGTDSRDELTREQRNQLSTGSAVGARTDTVFVLSTRGADAALLAFPRDLLVTLCDGSQQRLNAATAVGGPDCLVETVSSVSGLDISHWVQINFLGFSEVVDAVGGVELCLDEAIDDPKAGIDLDAGCQRLGGPDALGFVRTRQGDSDLGRIERQQQFLRALAGEVATPATVLNPIRYYGVAGAMGGALSADDGLSGIDLVRLGLAGRGVATGRIVTATIPVSDTTLGGAQVLSPVEPDASELFARFASGAIFDDIAERTDVDPSEVSVAVLNGSGVEGLAGRTAAALEAEGFVVAEVGNAPPTERTEVRHPPDQVDAARTLAALAPADLDVTLVEDTSIGTVTLVLGSPAG